MPTPTADGPKTWMQTRLRPNPLIRSISVLENTQFHACPSHVPDALDDVSQP